MLAKYLTVTKIERNINLADKITYTVHDDVVKEDIQSIAILQLCKSDTLISSFARSTIQRQQLSGKQDKTFLEKFHDMVTRFHRLVEILNKGEMQKRNLHSYISSAQFNRLRVAAQQLFSESKDSDFEKSFVKYLRKIAAFKISRAKTMNDSLAKVEGMAFLQLLDLYWIGNSDRALQKYRGSIRDITVYDHKQNRLIPISEKNKTASLAFNSGKNIIKGHNDDRMTRMSDMMYSDHNTQVNMDTQEMDGQANPVTTNPSIHEPALQPTAQPPLMSSTQSNYFDDCQPNTSLSVHSQKYVLGDQFNSF